MTEYISHKKQLNQDGHVTRSDEVYSEENPELEQAKSQFTLARVVWYIAGILLALLAIRFLLALLGANPANTFAQFIYNISYPFVAPFFGLFSYTLQYGASRFESGTLVAMVIYTLIAFGITRLITINHSSSGT